MELGVITPSCIYHLYLQLDFLYNKKSERIPVEQLLCGLNGQALVARFVSRFSTYRIRSSERMIHLIVGLFGIHPREC